MLTEDPKYALVPVPGSGRRDDEPQEPLVNRHTPTHPVFDEYPYPPAVTEFPSALIATETPNNVPPPSPGSGS